MIISEFQIETMANYSLQQRLKHWNIFWLHKWSASGQNAGTGDSVGDATGYIRETLIMLINSCPQNQATTSYGPLKGTFVNFRSTQKSYSPSHPHPHSSACACALMGKHAHTHRNVSKVAVKAKAILARLINLKQPPPASYLSLSESSNRQNVSNKTFPDS